MPRVLLDNSYANVTFPASWSTAYYDALGGSVAVSAPSETPMVLQFTGTSISIFCARTSSSSALGDVIIDKDSTPVAPSTLDGGLLETVQCLQTDERQQGHHTLTLQNPNIAIDYFVVNTDGTSSTDNMAIIVDDTDPLISYNGNWTPQSVTGAHNSTIHSNPTSGDATFPFTGTSVSVYGRMSGSAADPGASLNMSYTIDGFKSLLTYYPFSSINNIAWYSNDTLPSGAHTLKIEILSSANTDFTLDYILYSNQVQVPQNAPHAPTPPISQKTFSVIQFGGFVAAASLGTFAIVFLIMYCCGPRFKSKRRKDVQVSIKV